MQKTNQITDLLSEMRAHHDDLPRLIKAVRKVWIYVDDDPCYCVSPDREEPPEAGCYCDSELGHGGEFCLACFKGELRKIISDILGVES